MAAIGVANQLLQDFQNLATKKSASGDEKEGKKIVYLIAKISSNEKEVETETLGYGQIYKQAELKDEAAAFQKTIFPEFAKKLSAIKEPRFAVIDFFYSTKDNRLESKLVILRWSPDSANGKLKMMYSSGEGSFKGKLGATKIYQANDTSDVTFDEITKFVQAK